MESLLSICIPTYNRSKKLTESLENLMPYALKHNILIYISDNASTDNTFEVVSHFKSICSTIFYHRNPINVGAHRNFDIVLRLPQTKYCWLLGDDDFVIGDEIHGILHIAEEGSYDIIALNGGDYDKSNKIYKPHIREIDTGMYNDPNFILGSIGYHLSWMSTLIFHRNFIDEMDLLKYGKYGFPHLIAIFMLFSNAKPKFFWNSNFCIYANQGTCDYEDKIFQYFCKDWYDISQMFTEYKEDAKDQFLYAHRDNVYEMKIKNFIAKRAKGLYNYNIYCTYKEYYKFVTRVNSNILLIIALIPTIFFKIPYIVYKKICCRRAELR